MRIKTLLLWLALMVPAGFAIYQVKFEVQQLEASRRTLEKEIKAEKDAIRVLRAEWSHLNEPSRIESLSDRHLGLKPVDQQQMLAIEDVPFRQKSSKSPGQSSGQRPPEPPITGQGMRQNHQRSHGGMPSETRGQ